MKRNRIGWAGTAACAAVMMTAAQASAATTVQVGATGKTYASSAVACAADASGQLAPVIEAGLFNPKKNTSADVVLNGAPVMTVTTDNPATNVWLADGVKNTVVVSLGKRVADTYYFTVQQGMCALPDTSGNTFSADGTLEYAASGKSYATVTPGCALNPQTGLPQPYVHLMDNGTYLLNVSINGQPLTQLSATRPHTPVFLTAGQNVISAANGYLTVDYYVRNGGTGTCALQ